MNLYEINSQIEACIYQALDPVTGELLEDELNTEKLEELEMEKAEKIENLAKWVKNLKAEADALKQEKLRLAEKQKKTESKIESLSNYIEMALAGEKFKSDDGTVDIRYRRSKKVAVMDGYTEEEVAGWLLEEGRNDLITQKAPTLNKTAIKQAFTKNGEIFNGIDIVETMSMQIN
jgi:NADH dehydrogenase/NADH:ubiquinone oxidoreductase subunit G